jgi:hypothetical protein
VIDLILLTSLLDDVVPLHLTANWSSDGFDSLRFLFGFKATRTNEERRTSLPDWRSRTIGRPESLFQGKVGYRCRGYRRF